MKKIKYLLLILCTMFLGMINVSAEETDFSDVTIDIKYTETGVTEENRTNAYLVFSGITLDEAMEYRVVFTKDTYSVVDSFTEKPELSSILYKDGGIIRETGYASASERFGDVYVTIYERENSITPYKKVSDTILVERPEELKLTKRIQGFLFENETSLFLWSINNINTERNVNYKIGKVTDNNILKNIKNNQYSGLESLLSYAKNDNNPIKSAKTEFKTKESLYSQSDVTEGTYYYVYFSLDTEEGKYYPVEDVDLYYAKKLDDEKVWLYDYLDSNFKWNLEEETIIEETPVENPKTGIQDYYALIGSIIVLASGIIIYVYKNRKFRKI